MIGQYDAWADRDVFNPVMNEKRVPEEDRKIRFVPWKLSRCQEIHRVINE